jgi:hypothetical protein
LEEGSINRNRDVPDTTNPNAVFAFMVAKPGSTLLRMSMSRIQPISTRQPMLMTKAAATVATLCKEAMVEELTG